MLVGFITLCPAGCFAGVKPNSLAPWSGLVGSSTSARTLSASSPPNSGDCLSYSYSVIALPNSPLPPWKSSPGSCLTCTGLSAPPWHRCTKSSTLLRWCTYHCLRKLGNVSSLHFPMTSRSGLPQVSRLFRVAQSAVTKKAKLPKFPLSSRRLFVQICPTQTGSYPTLPVKSWTCGCGNRLSFNDPVAAVRM